ncbi:hypothetical protein LTR56_009293 [Elasticomyces elasticus]|nr:hypothetical protein LTR22_021086 [Elasticomyces elasticus]KAK3644907.1 hypothetical protein LTR56_009293 [Elasticomyces elasticus]KAK4917771.1 hypothetical protein LTR49_014449 [Elasticomyces elasticus]KAK5766332.1 hypothetical protein LTS12_003544 [Elasticomyces elasticus]
MASHAQAAAAVQPTNDGHSHTPDPPDRHYEISISSDQTTLYEHHMANFRRLECNDQVRTWNDTLHELSLLRTHDARDRLDASQSRVLTRGASRDTAYQRNMNGHSRYIQVLIALSTNRLPKELVLRILAARAICKLRVLIIEKEDTIYKTAENLLGREAPNELVHLMEKTILEVVHIRLIGVTYSRNDTTATTEATFPAFLSTSLIHSIRTLVLHVDLAPIAGGYPTNLLRFTASMASLRQQLPQLHLLCIGVQTSFQGGLMQKLFEVLERLVTAVQEVSVGRRQVLALEWALREGNTTVYPQFDCVDIDSRSAKEVVGLAIDQVDAHGYKPRGL